MKFAAKKYIRRPRVGGDPVSFAVRFSEETSLDPRLRGDDVDSGMLQ